MPKTMSGVVPVMQVTCTFNETLLTKGETVLYWKEDGQSRPFMIMVVKFCIR